MTDFRKLRLIASIAGITVVMVAALVAFVYFATISLPDYMKVVGLLILGSTIVATTYRIWKGGEQGTIGLEITDG